MFEALGLIEQVSALAVFPDKLIMMDSVTGEESPAFRSATHFRKKFKYPYALIHRADLHQVLLDACRTSDLIRLDASQKVVEFDEKADSVTVRPRAARNFAARR